MSSPPEWIEAADRRPGAWLSIIAALFAVQIGPWWYPARDSVFYLSTARGLALHHELSALGNPQIGYPPGYSLLISPAYWLNERPFMGIAVIHWVLAVAVMLGIYRWARATCRGGELLVTALVMANASLWIHYRRVLSELPFMAVLVWSAIVLNATLEPMTSLRRLITSVVAGLLLVVAATIREVGLMLAAGYAFVMILRVRSGRLTWKAALICALLVTLPAAIAVALFISYEATARATSLMPLGTHAEGLAYITTNLLPQLIEGVRLRISDVGRLLLPGMFKSYATTGDWVDINIAIYVPLFALITVGWWKLVRQHGDVLALTMPFYLLAYVIWSFDSATRYLVPVLPVLVVGLWYALEQLRWRQTLFLGLLVAHLGVALCYWLIVDLPRAYACTAHFDAISRLAAQIPTGVRHTGGAVLPGCELSLLEVAVDRRVKQLNLPVDGATQWVVTEEGAARPEGYHARAAAEPYVLLVRQDGW